MRLIVVGARGATRDLLRRLGERWEATVVDPDVGMLVAVSAVVSPIGFRFLAPPLQSRPNDVGGRRLLGRS